MKKLSFIEKMVLRQQDYDKYKKYKYELRLNKTELFTDLDFPIKQDYHFKHSGNAGDIIYSLPAAYTIAKNATIHYHLSLGMKGVYGKSPHPLGNLMLNEKMVEMISPLLTAQPQIASCTVHQPNDKIDVDLDLVRNHPISMNAGHIARWYFYVFAVNADLGKPWLFAQPDINVNDHIVIARSQRYRAPGIDYGFLKKYKNLLFVGVEEEWKEMKEMLPHIEYKPVKNFLELAQIIAGSKLFIGNQSFPFSIAEGLKVKRLLEVYWRAPNVIPEGSNGYDFYFQPQFEKLVERLVEMV
ncbi:MAG: hypothetical protein M3Y85_04575 [Bacteroidota bacterium]|nr:hypothetical protein [Bacteroidota bacterium]